jgi:hypothetical protein
MSKLLKAVIKPHRPHIVAKLTKAHGYDENKHVTVGDLKDGGLISGSEATDLFGCTDDLADGGSSKAKALKAIGAGKIDRKKANDDDFIKMLGAMDSDEGLDDLDGEDDLADSDSKLNA